MCRSITFEKRVSKLFEWLKLPQGQRYYMFFIIIIKIMLKVTFRKDRPLHSTVVFGILDLTSTLCTSMNLTHPDIVMDQRAHRSDIH